MNRDRYRAAFDGIKFREAFQDETVNMLLDAAGQGQEKERSIMKAKQVKKTVLIAAVLSLTLVVSAFAVSLLLPAQVAELLGQDSLAAAFEQEGAIVYDASKTFGDYTVTLMGIVSGAGLSDASFEDVDKSRSYIVAAMTRTDGQPIAPDGLQGILCTPLVSGYLPWEVNIFTLGGGYSSTIADDMRTAYYIFECENLELFADHTVYLAVYEGFSPSSDVFQTAQDGSISFADGFTAPHALFTLPLDPAKADPAAADALLAQIRQPGPDTPEEDLDPVDPANVQSFEITGAGLVRATQE